MNDFTIIEYRQRERIIDYLNGILEELSTSEVSTRQKELIERYIDHIKLEFI